MTAQLTDTTRAKAQSATKEVPREPTPEMLQAGDDAFGDGASLAGQWRAMCDAATERASVATSNVALDNLIRRIGDLGKHSYPDCDCEVCDIQAAIHVRVAELRAQVAELTSDSAGDGDAVYLEGLRKALGGAPDGSAESLARWTDYHANAFHRGAFHRQLGKITAMLRAQESALRTCEAESDHLLAAKDADHRALAARLGTCEAERNALVEAARNDIWHAAIHAAADECDRLAFEFPANRMCGGERSIIAQRILKMLEWHPPKTRSQIDAALAQREPAP